MTSSPLSDGCCSVSKGAFTQPRHFDQVDGQWVPRPCCGNGEHAGPFGAKPRKFDQSDLDVDGYGWPPADYLPWGEAEKVIESMIAEDGPWTMGDPFQMSTGEGVEPKGYAPQPGPLGLVYLAGPMRGIAQYNFPEFHKAAKYLRQQGWGVFNPAEMDEQTGFDPSEMTGGEDLGAIGFDLREALGNDLAFITTAADAVAVLPGWENSKGANAEVATARALGLPVFDAYEGPSRPISDPVRSVLYVNNVRWSEVEDKGDGTFEMKGDVGLPKIELNYDRMEIDPEALALFMGESPSVGGEVRTVSASGGQKGVKPEQYDQIPVNALAELARHFGAGARKYAAHNFRKGYEWDKNFNAAMRHAWAFWGGEDYDLHKPECAPDCGDHLPESKHVIAAAWHFLVLATFMDEHPEYDTRYKPEGAA